MTLGLFSWLTDEKALMALLAAHEVQGLLLVAAAIAGDGVNFTTGRSRLGRWIMRKGWISDANMKRTKDWFDRRGASTVTVGRFVPIVRTIAPFVAGLIGMDVHRFFLFNIAGGMAWACAMVLGGYWLGRMAWVAQHLWLLSIAIVAISVLPVGIQWLRARGTDAARPGTHQNL